MPTAVGSDDCVSLIRAPTAAMVAANLVVFLKNGIDRRPGGFNRILAGEERSVAGHGVAQQQLVGRFFVRLLFEQIELPLIACLLYTSDAADE